MARLSTCLLVLYISGACRALPPWNFPKPTTQQVLDGKINAPSTSEWAGPGLQPSQNLPYRDHIAELRRPFADILFWGGELVDICIGTPPQHFEAALILHPGPLVFTNRSERDRYFPRRFNNALSSSYRPLDNDGTGPSDCSFDGLRMNGGLASDIVSFAGFDVEMPFFESRETWLSVLGPSEFDSGLSLARNPYKWTDTCGTVSPIHAIMKKGMLTHNLVGLEFRGDSSIKNGELSVGEINTKYAFTMQTAYLGHPDDNASSPLKDDTMWYLDIESLEFRGVEFNLTGSLAVLETMFPEIVLPDKIANLIVSSLAPNYDGPVPEVNCDSRKDMPNIRFTFATNQKYGAKTMDLTITPWDYVYEVRFNEHSSFCWLPIMGIDDFGLGLGDVLMLGTNFLKGFYTVFDYDYDTMSFASVHGLDPE